jgi:choline dehydrogenase-like flavoprotein
MLGRGLNEQASVFVMVDGDGLGYFGGTSITGHGYDLYDGDHRRDHSAILMEVYNNPVSVRPDFGHWDQRVRLKMIAEDLPQDRNRVVLDDDGAPHLEWHGHSDYAIEGLKWGVDKLPNILPNGLEVAEVSTVEPTEAHIIGTHRMGDDPDRHVIDHKMNVRGVSGLLALGSGAFTTTSPANPSLTISALSLRAARMLT